MAGSCNIFSRAAVRHCQDTLWDELTCRLVRHSLTQSDAARYTVNPCKLIAPREVLDHALQCIASCGWKILQNAPSNQVGIMMSAFEPSIRLAAEGKEVYTHSDTFRREKIVFNQREGYVTSCRCRRHCHSTLVISSEVSTGYSQG
jgi:hypothetical protein